MTQFSADHFRRWFSSIHGFEPFPWQVRLASEILEAQQQDEVSNAAWPGLLDLPTGTGKTSAIDIAIYTQAADPINAPRRVVYVVDRRAIVDQTAKHVDKIKDALVHPATPEQQDVAHALASRMTNSKDRIPLEVAQLRGGIALDDTWASEPDIPAVLISTVDQVGSRLLFRGYGVSKAMRPIHAGLLGNDCLWLLDEVHLSQPFAQTLADLQGMRNQTIMGGLPVRNGIVQMTATPVGDTPGRHFQLDDQLDIEANPVLKQRVKAKKEITLQQVKSSTTRSDMEILIETIQSEIPTIPGDVIGVIVNRVENAVKLGAVLSKDYQVFTLTGRMRPIERELIWPQIERIAGAERTRDGSAPKTIVVSTQTIEAGADLDFDGMISEIASLDAIVQRLGRVDRRGKLSASGTPAKVVLVGLSSQLGKSASDPIYGKTLRETWSLLSKYAQKRVITFDNDLLKEEDKQTLEKCVSPEVSITRLFPHHLDALSQTNPEPATQPVIAYHLHGVTKERGEVTVVWRGEVSQFKERIDNRGGKLLPREAEKSVVEQMLSCPPRSSEGIAVPLPAFRQWMQIVKKRIDEERGIDSDQPLDLHNEDLKIVSVADVERYDSAEDSDLKASSSSVLRWRGDESSLIGVDKVEPGDVLVVPLEYGGISEGNWDPRNTSPVSDIGDLAQWEKSLSDGTTKPTLRIHRCFGWVMGDGTKSLLDSDLPLQQVGNDQVLSSQSGLSIQMRSPLAKGLIQVASMASSGGSQEEGSPITGEDDQSKSLIQESSSPKLSGTPSLSKLLESKMVEMLNGFIVESEKLFSLSEGGSSQDYLLLIGKPIGFAGKKAKYTFETDGSDVSSSLIGVPLTLLEHSRDVAVMAERYAHSLGVDDLSRAFATAGFLHDVGKLDKRFQVFLHGGDQIRQAMNAHSPLAKSIQSPRNSQDIVRIRERSGYPKGTRHELLSLALMESHPEVDQIPNVELIKHLVATHHGWCRAIPPHQEEGEVQTSSLNLETFQPSDNAGNEGSEQAGPYPLQDITLEAKSNHQLDHIGSGIADRFWSLTRTYGWYGLAWLEAVLRLADHRQSAWREVERTGERSGQ